MSSTRTSTFTGEQTELSKLPPLVDNKGNVIKKMPRIYQSYERQV